MPQCFVLLPAAVNRNSSRSRPGVQRRLFAITVVDVTGHLSHQTWLHWRVCTLGVIVWGPSGPVLDIIVKKQPQNVMSRSKKWHI